MPVILNPQGKCISILTDHKMKKNWIITAVIFAVVIIAGIAFNVWRGQRTENTGIIPALSGRMANTLSVNGYIVREQSLADDIVTTGILLPDEEVNLSFETSGKITEINFKEGSIVRKGDLLAKVNSSSLRAQLARYEAQMQLAEDMVYRQTALLERDAVSQEAYERTVTELAVLQADINLVKANIALTEMKAPFDGVIGLRNVSEGAYASPNVAVATLTKFSPLKIDFGINEKYASRVKAGTKLTFTVDNVLKTFDAVVYATESKVNEGTLTLSVRALFPNEHMEIHPGRAASVRIRLTELPNALVIPSQAIIKEMGVDKVFVYRGGRAEPVNIEIGMRTDTHVQALSGLNPGDTLITSGTLQLRTGMNVALNNIE